MRFDELKDKALSLPLSPGVYIMKDKNDKVIYVGKAKKLKNRVSQYFQDTGAHTVKTKLMVSHVDHFDVIVAASEFEALVLECSLIKRHLPKYNILLKDDKGFPYLRLDMNEAYPAITMANRFADDADYYGPFGSRGVTNSILKSIKTTFKLPSCNRKFPRDIGKDRPCLNYHMNLCSGWCQIENGTDAYQQTIEQVRQLLLGNHKVVSEQIRKQMLTAAEELNFELAASLRDRLNAIETLARKQRVTAGTIADTDVIGYAQTEAKACFAVLHFSGGNLIDKDYEIMPIPDDREVAVSSLVKQYYLTRGFAPKVILLPFDMEDAPLFEQLLEQQYGRKTRLRVPKRGENVRLVELAVKNAYEEANRATDQAERTAAALTALGKMLRIDPPERIESFDISNISGTDIVGAMIVFCDGKPKKSEYKRFLINDLSDQDDYASMKQVLTRRFTRYLSKDNGFEHAPDLLLIDGGVAHAKIASDVLCEQGLSFPVFGMVKDDRHRTRALVTPDGYEIRIDSQQIVFSLIGAIQEETHRFAIAFHRQRRSKRVRYSQLDTIDGIGPQRKEALLKRFKSLSAISNASVEALCSVLPHDVALAVYKHFNTEGDEA